MIPSDLSTLQVRPGNFRPLGAVPDAAGVQFSLASRHATGVWLALFRTASDPDPVWEFELDPALHRQGNVWSVHVTGVSPGALYTYRVQGPRDSDKRHCFRPDRRLLDPYAKALVGDVPRGAGKCVVAPPRESSEQPDSPHIPWEHTIIYETHVRGLTVDPSAGVEHGGTYRGLVEKIPYLRELGVTTVELLPVQACGEHELDRANPDTEEPLANYWGYNPVGLFAPTARYASAASPDGQLHEFRQMVAALHRAGIEVILDVVFNHTAEGRSNKAALAFRGIDNASYYLTDESGEPIDLTGCGNTLNCNDPIVQDLIVDCLRYWVGSFHIDGFRFDLAATFYRGPDGALLNHPPVLDRITNDPVLRHVKLIAEPWDSDGNTMLGSFGGRTWAEWNGPYRDDVRRFWRGDADARKTFALRVIGSPDLYGTSKNGPPHSINYVTAHDGFTLRDLVSYERKHNEANGEGNRDGGDDNFSSNGGVEGETDDPEVSALRLRMQKSFLATLFLSMGTPMLLGGDEFGRTQRGNNNAYCQDNPISWYDWNLPEKNGELLQFCRTLIAFRKENPAFSHRRFLIDRIADPGHACAVAWFDPDASPAVWNDDPLALACRIDASVNDGTSLYLTFNPTLEAIPFSLPPEDWTVRITSARSSPGSASNGEIVIEAKALAVFSAVPGRNWQS